jgi:hypothetical protein
MFFKSLVKILEKGSHNPQRSKVFIYKPILTKIYGKVVGDGAGDKLRNRGRTTSKVGIFGFSIPPEL